MSKDYPPPPDFGTPRPHWKSPEWQPKPIDLDTEGRKATRKAAVMLALIIILLYCIVEWMTK